jgi:hypothetical protein
LLPCCANSVLRARCCTDPSASVLYLTENTLSLLWKACLRTQRVPHRKQVLSTFVVTYQPVYYYLISVLWYIIGNMNIYGLQSVIVYYCQLSSIIRSLSTARLWLIHSLYTVLCML